MTFASPGSFAAIFMSFCVANAAYASTSQAIIKSLSDAKIIAPGYKINAAIDLAHHEVSISTYVNADSQDKSNDCKIDALLIAKKVFDIEKEAARIRIRFYDHTHGGMYYELVVTKPEVAAFSAGAVKKEELLASLEVVTGSGGRQANGPMAIATPTARAIPVTSTVNGMSTYRKNGLIFNYPQSWGAKEKKNEYGDFLELFGNRTAWSSIIFRVQDRDSSEQVAHEDDKYFWVSHHRVITQPADYKQIGAQRNIRALFYYIKDNEEPSGNRFEKHVYFGYKHRIYSMSVRFHRADVESVKRDLDAILNSMMIE